MQACRSQYDYAQLVSNYIKFNLSMKRNTELSHVADKFTSTAKSRLSFDGPYLISYNTRVAKFVHTKKATYVLIDEYKYSNTTTKQIGILHGYLPDDITTLYVTDLEASFNDIKDEYITAIHNSYEHCKVARNGKRLQTTIEAYKSFIQSIISELHPSTRKATLRKLNTLPNIPDKLNKFTRPIILSVLKDKGLLWQINMNLLMKR